MTTKIAVIYYSATGTVRALAEAVADGAASAGAEIRLRPVAELTAGGGNGTVTEPTTEGGNGAVAKPTIDVGNGGNGAVAPASVEDLAWADAYAFGTPSRFGTPAAPLKHFLDQAVGLWREGVLADKPVTAFTSAHNRHGGNEATLLSLANVFYHWGALIVPPGYTDTAVYAGGGNPYGASAVSGPGGDDLDAVLGAARYQGARLARTAIRLQAGTSSRPVETEAVPSGA
ncbi:Trp repressor binding protein [[Actinomadura] parvosata subsp. kistnae]|uniref:NAD(P)H dehydrogenase n=1 Tax=[Actinomadura] parvosata subsp. kistnae TaxID=1909395 RepID=A0A1U9ZTZ2_9ACTN|nr:NAD(P)H-dependent oxidoreductase [Nonomuraea sp. ATCC 55076]AQZ61418.1 NAD(P)H dehydrogenase [Nonomuraea sp. ATCC 55076]SPL98106.1 Trp repressor binding protein [Actinomadura parvosata subsp. kistnae]